MKKIISILLILFTLMNFLGTMPVRATDATDEESSGRAETLGELFEADRNQVDQFEGGLETGEVEVESDNGWISKTLNAGSVVLNIVMRILMSIVLVIPKTINWIMTWFVTGKPNAGDDQQFTVENMLTGEYPMFGLQFWEQMDSGETKSAEINAMREQVAIWYYSLRNIAIVGSVVILVYIGLRMAIFTAIDPDSAQVITKYKKMAESWAIGLALLFVLHYIMMLIIVASDYMADMLASLMTESVVGFETDLMSNTWSNIWSNWIFGCNL